jgi:hypothetical protein
MGRLENQSIKIRRVFEHVYYHVLIYQAHQ